MSNPFEKSWEPTLIVEGGVGRLESLTVKNSQHSLLGTTPPTTEDREEMARRMDWADMPNMVGKSNASDGASGDQTYFGGGLAATMKARMEDHSNTIKNITLKAPHYSIMKVGYEGPDPAWDRYFELAFGASPMPGQQQRVTWAAEVADLTLAERQKRMVGDKDEVVGDVTAVRTVGQVVDGRDWLTVAEAMRLGVCRLCKEDVNKPLGKPMGPIITSDHGEEFAHEACLRLGCATQSRSVVRG